MRSYVRVFICLFLIPTFSQAANETNQPIIKNLQKKYVERTCDETPFLKTTRLACISCGVEKFTGKKPSEKYLAMIGFATSKYSFLGKTTNDKGTLTQFGDSSEGGSALELFQRNVIQKIQAYGFCVDGRTNRNGDIAQGAGYGKVPLGIMDLVFSAVSGSRSTNTVPVVKGDKIKGRESSTGYTTNQEKDLLKFFGFSDKQAFENLYRIEGWTYLTPVERQNAIREVLASAPGNNPYGGESNSVVDHGIYASSENGNGLRECVKQMNDLVIQKDSAFNLKTNSSSNQELCQLMAIECEIDLDFCTKTPKTGSEASSTRSGSNPLKAPQSGAQ